MILKGWSTKFFTYQVEYRDRKRIVISRHAVGLDKLKATFPGDYSKEQVQEYFYNHQ